MVGRLFFLFMTIIQSNYIVNKAKFCKGMNEEVNNKIMFLDILFIVINLTGIFIFIDIDVKSRGHNTWVAKDPFRWFQKLKMENRQILHVPNFKLRLHLLAI